LFSQKKITGSCHTAARFIASWNAPWAGAPSPKNATATLPSARSCAAVAAPTAIGRPAATIPLAPKIPSVGSAMCMEPPRPRLVPWSLPISSANIPSGSSPLAKQWPWPRWVEVMTSAGPQRPARAHGRRLLPDREVHEAGDLAVAIEGGHPLFEAADQQHPAVHLDEVVPRECGRRGWVEWSRTVYCTGRYKKGRAMIDQIEIPESFPSPGAVSGKRVVITGASRGLGALLAHAFSHAGASVALVARTERDLKAVAEALPGPSLVLSGDVTDEDFNEAVADATVTEWGGVDAWICNAGISPIVAGPRQTDASVWRQILEVNLTGAFLGARAAARVMGEGGRLIFTGSVLGERPRKGLTAYSASKAGVVGRGQGPGAGPGPRRHHGERRGPRMVRFAIGRRVEEQPRALGLHHRAHRATALGSTHRPGRRLPVLGLRRVRVRHRHRAQRRWRILAGMTPPRRVVAITGAGGALGAACRNSSRASPPPISC
jgi:hypothetical protein